MNATELAQDVFGLWGTLELEPTAAQLGSVRRAIRHLVARGVIVDYFSGSGRSYWQLAEPDERKRRQRTRHDPSGLVEEELAHRFVKLLGLLSSDHAGERANAVLAVERLRQRYGIGWRDIVREGITVPD
jgi:hypothetical protein